TAASFSAPGLIVATRKIAALVSGAATGCGTADKSAAVIGSKSIGISRRGGRRLIGRNRPRRLTHLGEQSEACFVLQDEGKREAISAFLILRRPRQRPSRRARGAREESGTRHQRFDLGRG